MFKRLRKARLFLLLEKALVFSIVSFLVLFDFAPFLQYGVQLAHAAEVTIDATVSASVTEHVAAGNSTVFISDQVGYRFYVDSDGRCKYTKTTDGGGTWGSVTTTHNFTSCATPVVWYDQWTPGDTGDYIHIATMDPNGSRETIYYNRLDTTSDTLLLGSSPVDVGINSGNSPLTLSAGGNKQTISKATDGTLYMGISDNTDGYVARCASGCNVTTGWTEAGSNPFDLTNDFQLLMPLSGGDMLLINRDRSANDIRSKVWNGTSWDATWAIVDASATENGTYDVGMSAVAHPDTGDIYLAYVADHNVLGTNDDIRTAVYSGSWSTKSDIITNDTKGLLEVSMFIDDNTDEFYVTYTARTDAAVATSSNVYWATSSAAFTTWSAEQGPLNTTAGNLYGLDTNYYSDERIYVTWTESDADDLFGETLADISPVTVVSATGTQTSDVTPNTTNIYAGGGFVIKENVESRSLTTIRLTETGTVHGTDGIANIALYYDLDTSAPYDCSSESYDGGESQFGSTDLSGFSGANGTASFSDVVTISPTQTACVYVVFDTTAEANDGETFELEIADPSSDVSVSGGSTPIPETAVSIDGTGTIHDAELTQTHYNWRNDDGSETTATSISGTEDTPVTGFANGTIRRLRMQVSAEGSTTSPAVQYRLEYAQKLTTCEDASSWTDVGTGDGGVWDVSNSPNLTDGNDTTNVLLQANGGVTDPGGSFLSSNGAQKDASSQTGNITLDTNEFVEIEYAIEPTVTAPQGNTYCFRVTNAGVPIKNYDVYPEGTISADISVSASSTHVASVDVGALNAYIGGTFVIERGGGNRTLTDITLTETGTVDAENNLNNIQLFYDLDTTAPYDCTGESYGGSELQFGATDTNGFSAANGSSTFSGSVTLNSTQSFCGYVVMDVSENAVDGETVTVEITDPSVDVVVTTSTVGPSTGVSPDGSVLLTGPILTQTHYHWRNDDGTETGATSATGGSEDTPLTDFAVGDPVRLRLGVSNEGATTSKEVRYELEYGIKLSTCDAVSVWTSVDAQADAWDMYDSASLSNGETTTDIAEASGGLSDANDTFLTANGNVRDTDARSASTTLANDEYVDIEYAITSSSTTLYDTTYCFRVSDAGTDLLGYDTYAELTTAPKRDFKVQRGVATVSGTSTVLYAGVDYTAPSAATAAFIRITNTHHTGAGRDVGGGGQNAEDYSAYILDPENIVTSVTIARDNDSINNSRVAWEIVEYIGESGLDNEMIVRDQGYVSYGSSETSATGPVTAVSDDDDVVVFITGQAHRGSNRTEPFAHMSTASWNRATDEPVFERGAHGGNEGYVSYAVVEFVGLNWQIQRVEHAYQEAGQTETENITAVNSLTRTFLHTQKRYGAIDDLDDFGHDVYLSSIGAVSFALQAGAATTSGHVSVAWVIENTQTTGGSMEVQRSNGNTAGGIEPFALSVTIADPLSATNNASIFSMTSHSQVGTVHPRGVAAVRITATTSYEVWRSDTGGTLSFRTEIVEWPVSGLGLRQNYYRFYVDNDALDPTDPWPPGGDDVGENTVITALDEPLAEGERIRIRMSAIVRNADLPAGLFTPKLQYGLRVSTCGAVTEWIDVGQVASSTVWRGYDAPGVVDGTVLGGDPPSPGELNLSVSETAGNYVEENPSPANPYQVSEVENIEYDWLVEHNGADSSSDYCFRMVNGDGTPLDGYENYPQLRTAGFTPVTGNWRWYDDSENETPTTPLAVENTAPVDVENNDALALRITVDEIKNVQGNNTKFKLQFSESPTFEDGGNDVVASSSCVANSLWCYADGGGADNESITTGLLSDSASCVAGVGAGCGTHNTTANVAAGDTHAAGVAREYSFTLKQSGARVGALYYFRLFDVTNISTVVASTTYPSVVAGGSEMTFSINGVDAQVSTEGITTDATTTASSIAFGSLAANVAYEAAHTLTVNTNATEGYQIFIIADQHLTSATGGVIQPVTGTNASPSGWNSGCSAQTSCMGYHTGDDLLESGSTRFGADDSYAAFSTVPQEVMYSSLPSSDSHDIVYKIEVGEEQPAGIYQNTITYIAVPVY